MSRRSRTILTVYERERRPGGLAVEVGWTSCPALMKNQFEEGAQRFRRGLALLSNSPRSDNVAQAARPREKINLIGRSDFGPSILYISQPADPLVRRG